MINSIYTTNKIHRIIITPGEPAGIGPDIVIMALQKRWPIDIELVICADTYLLLNRAKQLNLPLQLKPYRFENSNPSVPGKGSILHVSLNNPVIPGQLDIQNNTYVIHTLQQASQKCILKEFSALVTGPVNKAILNQGGIPFTGHTEFFEQISHSKKTVMMLSNDKFRVALATTHIPVLSISQSITPKLLSDTINILIKDLKKYFKIINPRIYVCGLNPHAGDSGYIGQEEITIIIPTLNHLRKYNNYDIIGPLSADTIFQKKYLSNSDAILVMYHDQGLPVLKYAGFNQSINITLGLPFIRTSVGHGSAIELSGTSKIIPNSMNTAISTAINMIRTTYENQKIL